MEAINRHREAFVRPSDTTCVDESISRWYGLGGHWIDVGLPHYVSIDRKPEAGCEIQNAACASSGIIPRLELVTTAKKAFEGDKNHGTAMLHRLICADSCFYSVESAKWLKILRLRFTGVVQAATRKYPMAHLGALEMEGRGDMMCLCSTDDETDQRLLALCWVDRARRYYI